MGHFNFIFFWVFFAVTLPEKNIEIIYTSEFHVHPQNQYSQPRVIRPFSVEFKVAFNTGSQQSVSN